jgi:hypothetical protein
MNVISQTQALQQNIFEVEKMYVKLRGMQNNMQVVMLNGPHKTGKVARPHIMINGEDAEKLMGHISELLFNSAQLLKTVNSPLGVLKEQVRREVIEELIQEHRARGQTLIQKAREMT